jgi:hypothetical protein
MDAARLEPSVVAAKMPCMYDVQTRRRALSSLAAGLSLNRVSQQTGVSRASLREWRDAPPGWASRTEAKTGCCRCRDDQSLPEATADYGYLLGLYLGDGYINPLGPRGVWILRISCDDHWPGLQDECARAIGAVMPHNKVGRVAAPGCHTISAYSKHWPCLLPQHGPGVKHNRPIVLEPWQLALLSADPKPFLRGLFHSDGCRITNWTVRPVGGEPKRYEYPRYFFSNRSEDILGLCTWALDLLDIRWRRSNAWHISVARREAVAALDEFVGPKY